MANEDDSLYRLVCELLTPCQKQIEPLIGRTESQTHMEKALARYAVEHLECCEVDGKVILFLSDLSESEAA